ncbi:hypothetical protein PsorP6_017652 [Peronosclerospora sorghi]|uniref:Uncharacterized protein n=1 Tax=Peronosclerospora sorghi TaxID=230839 RepID=A0ACC0WN68_9STRA|nr:hypothetical protein PsorP6_017652 [Peronosclerospora sorghi]
MKLVCFSAFVLHASAHATLSCDDSKLTEPCAVSYALEHLSARRHLRANSPTAMDDEERVRIYPEELPARHDEPGILDRVINRLESFVVGGLKRPALPVATHVFNRNNPYTKAFEKLGLQNVNRESLFSQPEFATWLRKKILQSKDPDADRFATLVNFFGSRLNVAQAITVGVNSKTEATRVAANKVEQILFRVYHRRHNGVDGKLEHFSINAFEDHLHRALQGETWKRDLLLRYLQFCAKEYAKEKLPFDKKNRPYVEDSFMSMYKLDDV